jgi:hypothetical protein
MKPPGARLYALLAREAPVGVIFRRGPSRQTLLIRWDTTSDTFETGQWFKGRLFERRSDLSPDGSRLIYFAAKYKQPLYAWTAISRPPYLTALALWPKDDTYNGGGRFVTGNKILLNHPISDADLHPDFRKMKVPVAGYAEWRGEDDTVQKPLLVRDGWKLINQGRWESISAKAGGGFVADPPELWRKPHPAGDLALETALVSFGRKPGAFYCWKFRVLPARQPEGEAAWNSWDWADWDKQGDLVYAQGGALYRQTFRDGRLDTARLLADFTGLKYEEVQAPEWATHWR